MFCPKCRTEYRKGFYICADCEVTLVPELPPEQSKLPDTDYVNIGGDEIALNVLAAAPNDTVLLQTTNDSTEAIAITGLLEASGITPYTVSDGASSAVGRLDWSVLSYKIFVKKECFNEAQKIINYQNENTDIDREWTDFKQKTEKRGAFWGRVSGLITATFFYSLSFLPAKDNNEILRYVAYGASLCFILLVLFSFYRGKEK